MRQVHQNPLKEKRSPEWVGQEIEGSCGNQDGPAGGAKALSSSVRITKEEKADISVVSNDEMNKNEGIVISSAKKQSQRCNKTDSPEDTLLPSEASQVPSVEKLQKSHAKPSTEGLETTMSLTEAN